MHDYMIEAGKRRRVVEIIVCLYFIISLFSPAIGTWIMKRAAVLGMSIQINSTQWVYLKTVFSILFSGLGIGVLYALYNRWIWKWFQWIHGIPDLSGSWHAEVTAGLKGERKPKIQFTIKQTWTKIQVYGISENETTTVSESASILEQHGQLYFGYSYWIIHQDGQSYPGYNSLMIKNKGTKLNGIYFSAKNVEAELEDLLLQREERTDREYFLKKIRGCGSKGRITMERD